MHTVQAPPISDRAPAWLDRPLARFLPRLTVQTLLVIALLALAAFSRFYLLGARVMSHDEVNHVVYAYDLAEGRGYKHDPMTHGPFQFHIVALSYFLLGASDFTSRLPAALFSIATVMVIALNWRRYLGRAGALIGAALCLISPYMLFYGRYTRNDAFVALYGVLLLYAVLRYLEQGQAKYLLLFTAATVMHYITKETAYIYSAEILLFLALYFVDRVTRRRWSNDRARTHFIIALMATAVTLLLLGGVYLLNKESVAGGGSESALAAAALPLLGGVMLLALIAAVVFLVQGIGLAGIRAERSFDLLLLQVTLILPLMAAVPVKLVGGNPLDYSAPGLTMSLLMFVMLLLLAAAVGVWWRAREWALNAALFYGIFLVFYTTFFSNGMGFFTGVMGSLGYWMNQQDVVRGGQPLYYYALVQIPMYEFLPALATWLGLFIAWRKRLFFTVAGAPYTPLPEPVEEEAADGDVDLLMESDPAADAQAAPNALVEPLPAHPDESESLPDQAQLAAEIEQPVPGQAQPVPVLALLLFWSAMSMVAFSVAGERMPWLTVHVALPLMLAGGWALGYLGTHFDWHALAGRVKWLAAPLAVTFIAALALVLGALLGAEPPFAGKTQAELMATNRFLLYLLITAGSGAALWRLLRGWERRQALKLAGLALAAILAVLTIRASVRANYINYDTPLEYLVYAHAARGPKDALQRIEDLSFRLTGGKDLTVAYDGDGLYPFWWYLRDYPNRRWYGDNPTRDLRNDVVVITTLNNDARVRSLLGDEYIGIEYTRLWWPDEDYKGLTLTRLADLLSSGGMRAALADIWLNRDYTRYAAVTGRNNLTLDNWGVVSRMKMYVRKDAVARLWDYGLAPVEQAIVTDPYEQGKIALQADQIIGAAGSEPGQLQSPRAIAIAPDGSLFVADSKNNRIQHFAADGKLIQAFGAFGNLADGSAPGGTFSEPWGVAVSPDGQWVYVTDTWNNRVQKFNADGVFQTMWGVFGTAELPDGFWGPRGIAVDAAGRVFVADTGNKRIAIFDPDGSFLGQFGGVGMDPGQFDEPVAVAFDSGGNIYVTDTWNQRVQVLSPGPDGVTFTPVTSWDVNGWFGQSLDNKPFIAVDGQQHIFVTDPEGSRVIEFDGQGGFIRTWGEFGSGETGIGIASGIAVDAQGNAWVSDAGNHLLLHYTLPAP